jgi:heptosyltransferase-1
MFKSDTKSGGEPGILVVRLGAMGDVLHTLPAVASLKHNFPAAPLTWVVEAAWAPLLEDNPFVDRVVVLDRRKPGTWCSTRRELVRDRYSLAVDFQGLLKSAFTASLARPEKILGFDPAQIRERVAAWFYSRSVVSESVHAVDRNLDLARAAGALSLLRTFPLPAGRAEGELPQSGFVLASPFAGWDSKQWPLEHYAGLAERTRDELGLPLVLNGAPAARAALESVRGAVVHISSIAGLIDATRRATAVVGVDSGPMHLAAALGKPGIAIFGPTDPARNGPYGGSLKLLCSADAVVRYQPAKSGKDVKRSGAYARGSAIDPAMRAVLPEEVVAALKAQVICHA